jgi:hypothetical protein
MADELPLTIVSTLDVPVILKHSATPGDVPSSLADGELAVNTNDRAIYYTNTAGAPVPLNARNWTQGSGLPDNSLGVFGDCYLDTTTFSVFTKGQSAWVVSASLQGVQGAQGETGAQGTAGTIGPMGPTGPTGTQGATGTSNCSGSNANCNCVCTNCACNTNACAATPVGDSGVSGNCNVAVNCNCNCELVMLEVPL